MGTNGDSVGTGQPGSTCTTQLLSTRYWWPAMHRDVIRYVASCTDCARSKTPRTPPAASQRAQSDLSASKLNAASGGFPSSCPGLYFITASVLAPAHLPHRVASPAPVLVSTSLLHRSWPLLIFLTGLLPQLLSWSLLHYCISPGPCSSSSQGCFPSSCPGLYFITASVLAPAHLPHRVVSPAPVLVSTSLLHRSWPLLIFLTGLLPQLLSWSLLHYCISPGPCSSSSQGCFPSSCPGLYFITASVLAPAPIPHRVASSAPVPVSTPFLAHSLAPALAPIPAPALPHASVQFPCNSNPDKTLRLQPGYCHGELTLELIIGTCVCICLSLCLSQILILSDPDVESSILISSDEGATFQKFSINFYIMSFLFHPSQENWLLAYSDDHKLYSSTDFGRKALSGLDKEADLVHIEAQTDSGLIQYVTCRAQRCPDGSRQYPFSSQIDTNSLVVQDEYIFLQLTTAGRTTYFVSYQRGPFRHIQLPKYCLPKDMHIISTEDGQVLAAVQEWNENDTYSLYISDTTGVYFTRSLPHLRTSRGLAGNLIVDIYKVAGVNGILIANKKESKHMKTFITYNNGQTWNLLPAPPKDISGHGISCSLPSCSLHLHLQMSENPYTPDTILTKQSSPGLIVARGNVGDELSFAHSGMFISSDAGNTWRQIFEEEHSVWFLDNGGALMAITQASVPTQHLWISMDEGRQWNRISFSSTPLFVDGVLMEQDTQNYIITFFGHFSYLSDWQLVKIDYSGLFNGKCTDGDYQTWPLHYKGEVCVMGKRRVYMKRKPGTQCSLGKEYPRIISADPCICTLYDFECDYGFERQASGKCAPAFWHNAHTSVHTCSQGHSSLNSTGYRRVHSNNCKDGLMEVLSPKVQQCVTMPPRGLHLQTINKQLRANLGTNVTFRVTLQQGDSVSTSLHLDFGDGISVSYSNFSRLGDGIIHVYRTAGIFRVIAHAQNSQGSDTNSLYLHITSPLERISLSAPVVAIRGRQTNLTAIVWPSQPLTATFYWWLSNSTEVHILSPLITLGGSVSHTFLEEGRTLVMVQVSDSSTVLQDSQMVTVKDFFRSLLLSFSPNLEENNPSVAEWRQDVGRVVRATLSQVHNTVFSPSQVCGFPEEQLLVSVFPGSPTVAELFIFPETNHSQLRVAAEEKLDKMSEVFINALNQNLIYFDLKPDTRITVSVTQLTLGYKTSALLNTVKVMACCNSHDTNT
ncbi:hypothetical protein P4O66_011767, partial [Electrophorus voltai]